MTIDQLTAAVSAFEVANCEWEILIGSGFRIGKAAEVAAAEAARKFAAIRSKAAIDAAPEAVRQEWLAGRYNRTVFSKLTRALAK
jgi:hypothetical protein